MDYAEIDLKALKEAVNVILDHLITDLRFDKIAIEESSDHYWHCPTSEIHDVSKTPSASISEVFVTMLTL